MKNDPKHMRCSRSSLREKSILYTSLPQETRKISNKQHLTLESPLDCKEIQPVHPKGDQSWVFIGRTDAEAETPVLWPPHVKS